MIAKVGLTRDGIRLLEEKEFFLSFDDVPLPPNSSVCAIHNVDLLNEHLLYFPDRVVDHAVVSIEHPERFPLVAK